MQPRQRNNSAYTLVELLAGMTILVLMLFLINELFNNTSAAVSRSVQTSKVIATTRILTEQVSEDFDNMLGPSSTGVGGYLVIVQQRLPDDRPLTDPATLDRVEVDGLRSDQIVFIRDAKGLRSTTPETASSFGSRFGFASNATDAYAKVWYGHALRVRSSGLHFNLDLGDVGSKLDRILNDAILGRQALLFNPVDLSNNAGTKLSASGGGYTTASNAYYDSVVSNSEFPGGADRLWKGLTDVTTQEYFDAAGAASNATLFGQIANGNDANYVNTNYGPTTRRLRVNANPDAGQTSYASWAAAQAHGILAQSCSEVIIDFAADLNGDGLIDTVPGGGTGVNAPQIRWYDTLRPVGADAPTWTAQTSPVVAQPRINVDANTNAFIFRIDDAASFTDAGGTLGTPGTAHSYWPYMIRIRYRLHDTRGRLTSNNPDALRDGLDNDGDGVTDAANGDTDEDKFAGRWIEHIVRVPRP